MAIKNKWNTDMYECCMTHYTHGNNKNENKETEEYNQRR